jgi:DsbC/DsbD-like thiol-disulfide interchange protein
MSSLRLPLFALPLIVSTLLVLLCASSAQAAAKPAPVKASLVAADASVKPGQPLTVALRLVHDAHWHTYWLNPGTGLATSLKWNLPAGWTAGEIQWPAPLALKDKAGNTIGNGYEGTVSPHHPHATRQRHGRFVRRTESLGRLAHVRGNLRAR